MTFELPERYALMDSSPTTSASLRDLEQNAPNVTPKVIRAALVQAAQKLEDWERKSADVVAMLEEALTLRVGQMDSQSKAIEVDRQVKNAMTRAVELLRG